MAKKKTANKNKKAAVGDGGTGGKKKGTSNQSPKKKKKQKKANATTTTKSPYATLAKHAKKHSAESAVGAPYPAMSLRTAMESMSLGKAMHKGIAVPRISKRISQQGGGTQSMHEGIPVIKISQNGHFHHRLLTLSKDQLSLFLTHRKVSDETVAAKLPKPVWTPSKGWNATYMRYIDVADLDSWQLGVVGTQVLERALVNNKKREEVESQIVTIYHTDISGQRSLNLLVENSDHRKVLVFALDLMKKTYLEAQQWIGRETLLLRYIWYDVDADKNRLISAQEFSKVCARINLFVKDTNKQFREFLKTNNIKQKEITYAECCQLLKQLKIQVTPASATDVIWKSVFGDVDSVTAKVFYQNFMLKAQREVKTDLEDAKGLIAVMNSVEIDEHSIPENALTLSKERFEEFLRSEWNDAFDPAKQKSPKTSLNEPITKYWINTSHNTYLTGDQLRSKSSVEAYALALQRGCKCLELDCWDGGVRKGKNIPEGDRLIPVIYHGHTLTSKIEFRDVLLVVNKYLQANPKSFPVILSLENHCSHAYQETMAKMLKDIFKKRLFVPTTFQRTSALPCPEGLLGMVVIKGKRPPEPDDGTETGAGGAYDNNPDDPYAGLFDKFEVDNKPSSARISSFVPRSKNLTEEETDIDKKDPSEMPKYAHELLEVTLFHGAKFKFFEDSIDMLPSHMHSIGETKISKIVKLYDNNPTLWRNYNSGHMTRTYPAGSRVDSSNYNPILAWSMGCQLVALNFQTQDDNLTLNDGRFRQQGNSGYVLKPDSLLGGDKPAMKKITIRVLGGSCLPKSNGEKSGETVDPLVKVEMHDVRMTNRGQEQFYIVGNATKCVDNNGYNPVWKHKGKEFVVESPDVAMVLFKVMDEDVGVNDEIASAAIPVSCLRKGYRSVQLYDQHNSRLGPFHYATLLVHIEY